MKIILDTLKKNSVTLVIFILMSIFDITLPEKVGDVFFTVSGILFSIGMSQVMGFDFSAITNDIAYKRFSDSLKSIQQSFCTEFIISAFTYLILVIKGEKKYIWIFNIWKFKFDITTELQLIVIFSVVFFLFSYLELFKNKTKITEKIRLERKR